MSDNQEKKAFSIDLNKLKSKNKPASAQLVAKSDAVAEEKGFVSREPKARRGRKPSPRTAQIHTKVLPPIGDAIANEAQRRGVTQGVVIEEGWALYALENGL